MKSLVNLTTGLIQYLLSLLMDYSIQLFSLLFQELAITQKQRKID
jgi:hypothetical protein